MRTYGRTTNPDGTLLHCAKCGQDKPTDAFGRRPARPRGFHSWCKPCCAKNSLQWKRDHIDIVRAADRAHRRSVPREKKRASEKRWRQRHPEKERAKQKAYRAANPDSARKYEATYLAKNPDSRKIIQQNRRARIRKSGGKISKELPSLLLAEQGNKCPYCMNDLRMTGHHLDHYMPIILGGKNEDSNIQLLCPTCNLKKAGKHPAQYEASLAGFSL